jgi:adenylate kinase
MRIVFVGPPGAGKGTQAQRLSDHLGLAHLSTGEMFREANEAGTEVGKQAASYFQVGKLVPDAVTVGIVAERLANSDCEDGCLFDGFPRTAAQAETLDAMLAEQGIPPLDLVIALDVPENVVLKRLANRGRPDDNACAVQERLKQYHELTAPLADYYQRKGIFHRVDGTGAPEEVFKRIRQIIDQANEPWR